MNGNADANNDRIITITELFSYLERNVKEKSQGRQSPLILGVYDPNLVMSFVRSP